MSRARHVGRAGRLPHQPGSTASLRTERLELRLLPPAAAAALPSDRAAAAEALGAELAAEWPLPDFLDLLPILARAEPESPFGAWAIVEQESSTVVGEIGFTGPPAPDGTVELGYSVVPARRGRGYATEAASALAAWALGRPEVTAVVAGCDPENAPSIRVLERAGFRRTAKRDGQLRWRLDASS